MARDGNKPAFHVEEAVRMQCFACIVCICSSMQMEMVSCDSRRSTTFILRLHRHSWAMRRQRQLSSAGGQQRTGVQEPQRTVEASSGHDK